MPVTKTTERNRRLFEAKGEDWVSDGLLRASFGHHGLLIEIADSHAPISPSAYTLMSRDTAIKFRDWLNEYLAGKRGL